jgi:hypothetical protein
LFFRNFFDKRGGITTYDGVGGHIFGHHRSGGGCVKAATCAHPQSDSKILKVSFIQAMVKTVACIFLFHIML